MNSRARAARILAPVLAGKASLEIPASLAENKDRPLIAEFCYGSMRQLPRLQLMAAELLNKPLRSKDQDIQALLLLGLYQLEYMRIADHAAISETVQAARQLKKNWACGLLNAALRRWQREHDSLIAQLQKSDEYQWACPAWLLQRLQQDWPNNWQQIVQASNQQAPLTLRVNLQKNSRDALASELNQAGATCQPGELAPSALRLEQAVNLSALTAFAEGRCSVQDEAAQLCADLLKLEPGQKVLDACAAPGGKTGHLLECAAVELTALDISEERLQRVKENLQRLGASCQLRCADAADLDSWWNGQTFDRILLDAPCSGSGVMSRHPDIKRLRTPADVAGFARRQLELLARLWQALAPGGQLLYVTCSVLREENQQVVNEFLQHAGDAEEITPDLPALQACSAGKQLLPVAGRHDGFYYALMRKRIPG